MAVGTRRDDVAVACRSKSIFFWCDWDHRYRALTDAIQIETLAARLSAVFLSGGNREPGRVPQSHFLLGLGPAKCGAFFLLRSRSVIKTHICGLEVLP